MKQALFLTVLLVLSCRLRAADGKVIYSEDFENVADGTAVSVRGWRIHAGPKQSTYVVRDGVLEVTCMPETYKGGYAEIDLPVCRRGVLEFDVNIAMRQKGNARGIGLTMDVYNIGLWWHDYCKDWRRYFPEPVGKRLPGFSVEPVGHKSLCKVDKEKWHHYRVVFDTDGDLVEYYMDDMIDPVCIDADVPVLGRCEWYGGTLCIGNMGVTNGPVVYGLDNLVLTSLDDVEQQTIGDRVGCLVFRGLAFERYRLDEALAQTDEREIRKYSVISWRSPPYARNTLKLDRVPSSATVAKAKAIVLADMPAGPDDIMPEFLLQQIADSVKSGGRLVVLGGLFAFDKGCYRGTPLERVLPVELGDDVWKLETLPQPLPLKAQLEELAAGLAWDKAPRVLFRHRLALRKETKVLLTAGDLPILVARSYGEGQVLTFLSAPCGTASPGTLRFWDWQDWPSLLARMIAPGTGR